MRSGETSGVDVLGGGETGEREQADEVAATAVTAPPRNSDASCALARHRFQRVLDLFGLNVFGVSAPLGSLVRSNIGDHVFDVLLAAQAREGHRCGRFIAARIGEGLPQILHPDAAGVWQGCVAFVAGGLKDRACPPPGPPRDGADRPRQRQQESDGAEPPSFADDGAANLAVRGTSWCGR